MKSHRSTGENEVCRVTTGGHTETGTHGRSAEKATGEADTERESLQSARLWTILKALQIPVFCEFSEFDKHQIGFFFYQGQISFNLQNNLLEMDRYGIRH